MTADELRAKAENFKQYAGLFVALVIVGAIGIGYAAPPAPSVFIAERCSKGNRQRCTAPTCACGCHSPVPT